MSKENRIEELEREVLNLKLQAMQWKAWLKYTGAWDISVHKKGVFTAFE